MNEEVNEIDMLLPTISRMRNNQNGNKMAWFDQYVIAS